MATHAPYNPGFNVDALGSAEADAAYPLVRAIAPEIALDEWLEYVERRSRAGGLMGLFGCDGALIGLFSYRIGERLRHGRVLALDDFVSFELSKAAPGRTALLKAAEKLAFDLGCTGLEVRISSRGFADPQSDKAATWTRLGVDLDSVIFVKSL